MTESLERPRPRPRPGPYATWPGPSHEWVATPAPVLVLPVPRLRRAGSIVQTALCVTVVVHVGFVAALLSRYELLGRVLDGPRPIPVTGGDHRVRVWAVVVLVVAGLTAVAWLVWFARARSAAEAWGGRFAQGRGWAVGAWFVPFVNLVRPVRIALEINAGVHRHDPLGTGPAPGRSLVLWWWGALVAGGVLARVSGVFGTSASSTRTATAVLLMAEVCVLVAAVFAMAVVESVTRASDARRDRGRPETR